jgi:hypothetical protein
MRTPRESTVGHTMKQSQTAPQRRIAGFHDLGTQAADIAGHVPRSWMTEQTTIKTG